MKKKLSLFMLSYLRFFAKLQLAKYHHQNLDFKVIGVTGSAGKSSTVKAIDQVLSSKYKVSTSGNYNSESGLPLSILGIKIHHFTSLEWFKILFLCPIQYLTYNPKPDFFIAEMGIDSPIYPKNMDFLLSVVKPEIGVFLNVSLVHLKEFSSQNMIAQEKSKMINNLPQNGYAILNLDDKLVKKYSKTNAKIIPIVPFQHQLPLPKVYSISFGAAAAVAHLFDIHPDFTNFTPPPSRCSLLSGIKSSTIIDSSYNSSPLATKEMLEYLKTFPSPRIAILGDMRELGTKTASAHKELYLQAKKIANLVIGVGPNTQKYFGKSPSFQYYWQALDYVLEKLPKNSTILIKGSQNEIFLEELVKGLLQNPKDKNKLCRQSPHFLKLKQKFIKKFNV